MHIMVIQSNTGIDSSVGTEEVYYCVRLLGTNY